MNLVKYLYLLLFFFAPLAFTSFNSELFELPKMYFVYFLTTIILFLHLWHYLSNHRPLFRRTPLDLPLILLLLSQIISTVFSIDPHTSFFGYYSRLNGGLLSLVCYLFLYWILVIYLDDDLRQKIISASLLSGFLVATYGILEHFGIDQKYWVQDVAARVFSTLGQPNWLAAYLCILLPLALSRLLSSSNKLQITIYSLLITNYWLCLLFTKSKTGLAAGAITLTICLTLYLLQSLKTKQIKNNFAKAAIVASIFITLSLTIDNPIKDKFFPQPSKIQDLPSNILVTPSEDIRRIVWQGAFKLWQKFPIFGTGVETFAYSYYFTRPIAHNLTSEWDFLYNKAHNEYLNYLATTGAFGFLTYLILIFSVLYVIRNTLYVIPFLSILITNFTGFSVVITSLYFFLLPALCTERFQTVPYQKPKSIFLKFLLLSFIFYLLSKILFFYLADVAYTANQIDISLNYRPNEPVYLSAAALLAAKNGQIEKALTYSDRAFRISPFNTNLLKERAQMFYYLAARDPSYLKPAIETLSQIALLAPTDAKTFFLLGQFLESAQKPEDALKFYQHAVDLKPNYDHAFFALAKLYFEAKNYPLAKANFTKVLELAPANPDAKEYLNKIPKNTL